LDSEEKRFLESVKEDISSAPEGEDQTKAVYFMIGLALATILVSIFTFALTMSKQSQITSLETQIEEEVTIPLNNLAKERKQVTAITGQLDVLSTALSSRIKYGQIVKDLASNTYKQTRWSSLDYGEEGQVVLTGVADDFSNTSKAVSAFENFKITKIVDLSSVSIDESSGSVQYTFNMELDESGYKILSKNKASVEAGF
jgi:Tfp pilus assembly protein PilO